MTDHDIYRGCAAACIAFANAVDARDYPRVLDTFTDDAVFERWNGRFEGRDAIAGMLDARPLDIQTRHICTNIEIFPDDATSAHGVTYFQLFRGQGEQDETLPLHGPSMVGAYHDLFRLTDDGWRFAQRTIKVAFSDTPL